MVLARNFEAPQDIVYLEIVPEHPLMREVSEAIIRIQEGRGSEVDYEILAREGVILSPWEEKIDTCKSKALICYIHVNNGLGDVVYVGTNGMNQVLPHCQRFVNKIDAFDLCRNLCLQPGHAEVKAVINYLLHYGQIDFEAIENTFLGTYIEEGDAHLGIVNHQRLIALIDEKGLSIPEDTEIYLYGQEICCDECKKVLSALGVTEIRVAPQTHRDQYARRAQIHSGIEF